MQAKSRFEAIANTGGSVLGERALELDGIVPIDPMDMGIGVTHTVWGWATITTYAEDQFG